MCLTVALRARVAWSRLNPIETMVARCSSGRLSVGVVPGAELDPGNTKGAEKSGEDHREFYWKSAYYFNCFSQLTHKSVFTRVFHVSHHPVHSSINAGVACVVHGLPAGLQRKTHLTQLRHCGVIQHWSWETYRERVLYRHVLISVFPGIITLTEC